MLNRFNQRKCIMLRDLALLSTAILVLIIKIAYAKSNIPSAITQPIPIAEISEYKNYSPIVKNLIAKALRLSKMNLTYLYGSSNPKNKGMDCSGTIYYLLHQEKINDAPRQSNELFTWVEKKGKLYRVSHHDFNSSDFSKIKPGDLLFWSGTYAIQHNPPITHVMLYIGKNKQGDRLMFGASNGRTYQGKKMWGVSVFDFKLPKEKDLTKFEGYSCIPNLTCNSV